MRNSNKKITKNISAGISEKFSMLPHEGGPLLWIGMVMLICLVFLSVTSVLDLMRDRGRPGAGSFAEPAANINGSLCLSMCPYCGTQGIPQCFNCGNLMRWNPAVNTFSCPACGRTGSPVCPNCQAPMINADPAGASQAIFAAAVCPTCPGMGNFTQQPLSPGPLQNVAMTPPPGCATCPNVTQCFPNAVPAQNIAYNPACPSFNQCFPQSSNVQPAAFGDSMNAVCPGCGSVISTQPGARCPQCGRRVFNGI